MFVEYVGDGGHGIAVDGSGDAYVTGSASSDDFPVTSGAYQTANNAKRNHSSNAFVTKLNATGSKLIYSTYLGGSSIASPINSCNYCQLGDAGSAIAIDGQLNAYISGGTYSVNFPVTTDAFQTTNKAALTGSFESNGPLTGFISKLNTNGSALVYSTYLGGSKQEVAYGLAVDAAGDAFVTGFTDSADFPVTPDAYQSNNSAYIQGAPNAYVSEVNTVGSALIYSTFIGGSGEGPNEGDQLGDFGNSIFTDKSGGVYLTGYTASNDFPVTPHAFESQAENLQNGIFTGFVSKFSFGASSTGTTITILSSDGNPQMLGVKVTFTAHVTTMTGSSIPTGTVSFTIDGGSPVVAALDDTGHAELSTISLTAGTHSVLATYSGDSTYTATADALAEIILGPAAAMPVFTPAAGTMPPPRQSR